MTINNLLYILCGLAIASTVWALFFDGPQFIAGLIAGHCVGLAGAAYAFLVHNRKGGDAK